MQALLVTVAKSKTTQKFLYNKKRFDLIVAPQIFIEHWPFQLFVFRDCKLIDEANLFVHWGDQYVSFSGFNKKLNYETAIMNQNPKAKELPSLPTRLYPENFKEGDVVLLLCPDDFPLKYKNSTVYGKYYKDFKLKNLLENVKDRGLLKLFEKEKRDLGLLPIQP